MKQIILTIIAVILVGVIFFLFLRNSGEVPVLSLSPTPTATPRPSPTFFPDKTSENIILYSDSGYSPATLNVKKGDVVVFKNASSKMMWTASAVHPTHKVYPGSGIEMCGTNTLVAIFDACKGYPQGESWEFKFDNQGTWKYHNHLQPNHFGTVIVE